ncbi:hypothetical protein PoB_007572800 [Plakobranchus ocellatus]|uniref:Uncharacterized protein n=1 Tax=Plakobranchus ocellatus TaxID=259542 RepID=A0AAV4DYQ9_9GAST|nr:hypothetical protein PoB_007572800 [Plakobranchus ocellatus]
MEFNRDKRQILQTMGISDIDVNRYLDIDEKLKTFRAEQAVPSEVERIDQEKSAETHSALVTAVREQIERSMQPLRTAVDEIKASVSRELEEERFLLRDHLAAAQKEIMAQLEEIRHIQDQQLNQSEPCHHHQPDKGIQAEKIIAQDQLTAQQVQQKIPTEGPQEGIIPTGERGDVKDHDQQMPEICRDFLWFKEQVQLLQDEHKQYRQELRRQEQQQPLQHRVSVSKLELKEELGQTKDEIITSMKALWAFTAAELNDSSKSLNEKTTDAVCELSRCQEETKKTAEILTSELKTIRQLVVETKENVSPNLSKNQVYKTMEETKQMLAKIVTSEMKAVRQLVQTKENVSPNSSDNQVYKTMEETKQMLLKIVSSELKAVRQLVEETKENVSPNFELKAVRQLVETKENVSSNLSDNQVYKTMEETKQMLLKIVSSELKAVRQLVEETKENVSPNLSKNQVYKTVEETKQMLAKILKSELKAVLPLAEETKVNVSPNLSKNQFHVTEEETKQILFEILATASDTQARTKENSSVLQKVNQMLEVTKEIGFTKHVKNLNTALEHSDMSKTLYNLEIKLDNIQRCVESDTISVHENALRDFQIGFVGQAQRVIQKMVNPPRDPSKVFHFYIKNFHQLEGSGKTVFSLPYVLPIRNSLFAMHVIAHFKTQTLEMILGLVCPADPREVGLEYLGSPLLEMIMNMRIMGSTSKRDIQVAKDKAIGTQNFLKHTKDNYLQMGEPISCPELVSKGYNSFKERSVLIELEINMVLECPYVVMSIN